MHLGEAFLDYYKSKEGNVPAYSGALVVVCSTRDKTAECKPHQRRAPAEYTSKIKIQNSICLLFKHYFPLYALLCLKQTQLSGAFLQTAI